MRLKVLKKLVEKVPSKPLTRKDMYDKEGKSTLPKIVLKKYQARSKYKPEVEDEKHRKQQSG